MLQDFDTINRSLVTQVFISDLHLSLDAVGHNQPAPSAPLGQAFFALLQRLHDLPNLQQLYILGDWFEAWLGDDIALSDRLCPGIQPIIHQLQALSHTGCQIYVMHGNRDFLIGQRFCNRFNGKLIQEPYPLKLQAQTIRLEHGDALCTDDKSYQRFRKIIRHPLTKRLLLALPFAKREKIAANLRQQSKAGNAKKSMQIMDVNAVAVEKALAHADILLHGHTHRPAIHRFFNGKQRMVLGDWRFDGKNVEAVIGIVLEGSLRLVEFVYPITE